MTLLYGVTNPQVDMRPNSEVRRQNVADRLRALENERKSLVVSQSQEISIAGQIYPARPDLSGNGWILTSFDPQFPFANGGTFTPKHSFLPFDRECMGYAQNAIHEFQMKYSVSINANRFNTDRIANESYYSQNGAYAFNAAAYSVPLYLQFINLPDTLTNFVPMVQIPVGTLSFTPFPVFGSPVNWNGVWSFTSFTGDYDFINDNIQGQRQIFGVFSGSTPLGLDWNTDGDKFTLTEVEGWLDGDIGIIGLQIAADISGIQTNNSGDPFTDEYYHFTKTLGLNTALIGEPEYTEPLISMSTSVLITYKGVQLNIRPGLTI